MGGGVGGNTLAAYLPENRIFFGGAGGSGFITNNNPAEAADGGGIVIIRAAEVIGNGFTIDASGTSPTAPGAGIDGGGGGGAGGTVAFEMTSFSTTLNVLVNGGNGQDLNTSTIHGPGGGGGGGAFLYNLSSIPSGITVNANGGLPGDHLGTVGLQNNDALAGSNGGSVSYYHLTYNFDSDDDGITDGCDLDCDNDGILDTDEDGNTGFDPSTDSDLDGVPNYWDNNDLTPGFPAFVDVDGDGVNDKYDYDKDGIPDFLDLDTDNDGIFDVTECGGTDTNKDGIIGSALIITDTDADGLSDIVDADDGGTPLTLINSDGDARADFEDIDTGNDGIPDVYETTTATLPSGVDTDRDGIDDEYEIFLGGTPNTEQDTDGDGKNDFIDQDSDNDGIADYIECGGAEPLGTDTDGDGIDNRYDVDITLGTDANSDGIDDAFLPTDVDSDGLYNIVDTDSDNDGVIDNIEAQSTAGYRDPLGVDTDNDGLDDEYDTDNAGTEITLVDTDSDGDYDFQDTNSDNDFLSDLVECYDTDDDGVSNTLATGVDTDGDGLDNAFDGNVGYNATDGGELPTDYPNVVIPLTAERDWREVDTDRDGYLDSLDDDKDNDGITDAVEGIADTDGDGVSDYLDLDSDNDGLPDIVEAGGTDADNNGMVDGFADVNLNGIHDSYDIECVGALISTKYSDSQTNSGVTNPNNALGAMDASYAVLDNNGDVLTLHLPDILPINTIVSIRSVMIVSAGGPGAIIPGYTVEQSLDGLAWSNSSARTNNSTTAATSTYTILVATARYIRFTRTAGNKRNLGIDAIWYDYSQVATCGGTVGTALSIPDFDVDGVSNYLDADSDDDGVADAYETNQSTIFTGVDTDNDGIDDIFDADQSGSFSLFTNVDGDGESNHLDLDSDDDGILDYVENSWLTPAVNDADGDGIDDGFDGDLTGGTDSDAYGIDDMAKPLDTDGDGIFNVYDIDSDNDGIIDNVEAQATVGYISPANADADGDGIDNAYEAGGLTPEDTDGDGTSDFMDLDSDNDAIIDAVEGYDTNGDGTAETLAAGSDADNDGLDDNFDDVVGFDPTDGSELATDFPDVITPGADRDWREAGDTDSDGIFNSADLDDDNDGISDIVEGMADTDSDGIIDGIDLDSDNDGIPDLVEAGGVDIDGDGKVDNFVDVNGNGVSDVYDIECIGAIAISDDADSQTNSGVTNPNNALGVMDASNAVLDNNGDVLTLHLPDILPINTIVSIRSVMIVSAGGPGAVVPGYIVEQSLDGTSWSNSSARTNNNTTAATSTYTILLENAQYIRFTRTAGNKRNLGIDAIWYSITQIATCGGTLGTAIPNLDSDADGVKNSIDLDSDNDGLTDIIEASGIDADNDGKVDAFTDTDNDGYSDNYDGDVGNDGTSENSANALLLTGIDAGSDGIPDSYPNANFDSDSKPDFIDVDTDNDGVNDAFETTTATFKDGLDTDGDGIDDAFETAFNTYLDSDGDGLFDVYDIDSDNDGSPEYIEGFGTAPTGIDADSDGIDNRFDVTLTGGTDADSDGIDDNANPADSDNDGIYNTSDADSDDDGIIDIIESQTSAGYVAPTGTDTDNDGLDDGYDSDNGGITISPIDTDSDGTNDYLDTDSDGDGLSDTKETTSSISSGTDTDNDGIDDNFDAVVGFSVDNGGDIPTNFPNLDLPLTPELDWREAKDSDADGLANSLDVDDDNDGILDINEGAGDTDSDGIMDSVDLDGDNDGIPDLVEASGVDTDGDGIVDNLTDTDGDGLVDIYDTDNGGDNITNSDFDGDGIFNIYDLDSDADGIPDIVEAIGTDANNNAKVDFFTDANNNGYHDSYEGLTSLTITGADTDANGIPNTYPNANTDGTGSLNFLDIDADDDGITDNTEYRASTSYVAPSNSDDNSNGIDNSYDNAAKAIVTVNDTDADGIPDFRDDDSDGDGTNDIIEGHDTNGDGVVNGSDSPNANTGLPTGIDSDNDGLDDGFDNNIGIKLATNSGMTPLFHPNVTSPTTELDWRKDPADILPIELISFNASVNFQNVDLTWTTASEHNNDYFVVQRTQNLIDFEDIATIDGAGNSNEMLNYSATDESPLEGTSYYMLKQVDFDGKFTFSEYVAVTFENKSEINVRLFPNPVESGETVFFEFAGLQEEKEVLVVVLDIYGKEVYSKVNILGCCENALVAIDTQNKLAPGIYLVIGTSDNKIYSKKLIIK
ncbi:MAG: hypothetical protein A2265_02280 [Bacteroidetes bacterium RIFOXYA12_FULL_33_9]|nr:MAG: hypothetical protein A2265_02280 [Bacteroidetes bacterium RIFOXYA12_FULL_33_9]